MITVGNLIEKLLAMDPHARVVMAGYEGGLADIHGVSDITIVPHVNSQWYYGPHEDVNYYKLIEKEPPKKTENSVLIS